MCLRRALALQRRHIDEATAQTSSGISDRGSRCRDRGYDPVAQRTGFRRLRPRPSSWRLNRHADSAPGRHLPGERFVRSLFCDLSVRGEYRRDYLHVGRRHAERQRSGHAGDGRAEWRPAQSQSQCEQCDQRLKRDQPLPPESCASLDLRSGSQLRRRAGRRSTSA